MAQQHHQPTPPPGPPRRRRRPRAESGSNRRSSNSMMSPLMALLLLGAASIAPPPVEAQSAASLLSSSRPLPLLLDPAQQALQRHKAPAAATAQGRESEVRGGLRGAAGSAAADAGVKRPPGPSTAEAAAAAGAKRKGNGTGKTAAARDENAAASLPAAVEEDPLAALTPTQFSRLDFPIPKTLRAREALRLEGDEAFFSFTTEEPARPEGAVAGGRRNGSMSAAARGLQGQQHHEIVVDRYEDGPHGACKPSGLGGAEEQEPVDKKGKTGPALPQVTCNLRAALRWAAERHRQAQQGQGETIVTVYLPTRWPHLVTLGELAVAEKGLTVRVESLGEGRAIVDGREKGHPFLHIGPGASAELAHLRLVGFGAGGGKTAAVRNEGALRAYGVVFSTETGAVSNAAGARALLQRVEMASQNAKAIKWMGDGLGAAVTGAVLLLPCPDPPEGKTDGAGTPYRCFDALRDALGTTQGRIDLAAAVGMARDEGFEAVLVVDRPEDGPGGACRALEVGEVAAGQAATADAAAVAAFLAASAATSATGACNLRAAVGEAGRSGAPTLVYLPPAAVHPVTEGPMLVPADAFIKVTGGLLRRGALPVVDGARNGGRRLFEVEGDAYMELDGLRLTGFTPGAQGGLIKNAGGEVMLHRVELVSRGRDPPNPFAAAFKQSFGGIRGRSGNGGAGLLGMGSSSSRDKEGSGLLEPVEVFNEGTCSVWHSALRRPPPPLASYHPAGLPKPAATANAVAGPHKPKDRGSRAAVAAAEAAAAAAGTASISSSGGSGGASPPATADNDNYPHQHGIANAEGGEVYLNPCVPPAMRAVQAGKGQGLEVVGGAPWCVPELAMEDLGLGDGALRASRRRRRKAGKQRAPPVVDEDLVEQEEEGDQDEEAAGLVEEKTALASSAEQEEQQPLAAAKDEEEQELIQLRADWRPRPQPHPLAAAATDQQPPPITEQHQPALRQQQQPILVFPSTAQLWLVFLELLLVALVARGLAAALRAVARRHRFLRPLLALVRPRKQRTPLKRGVAQRSGSFFSSLLASAVAAAGASMSALFAGSGGPANCGGAGMAAAGAERPSAA